ncbi:MAG: VWA domain-containing protein [Lewinellaceae bacterium]|nr:VWA domain-containing protein [Lewinellaceae bacterium]
MLRFEHPPFFHLLWAIPVLVLAWWCYRRWRQAAMRKIGLDVAVHRLLPEQPKMLFRWRKIAWLLAFCCLVLAAANPQRGAKQQQAKQKSADILLAVDISQSMLCADIAPSRLLRAQVFASQLIKALKGERIGLIFFAGDAFLQMPLSTDYEAALMFLQNADPNQISEQGTALPAAINLARKSFDPDPGAGRALILITDGEDHDEDAVSEASSAYDDGIVLYTVGAGTPEGGPIPLGPGVFKRAENHELVRTKLNEQLLADVARAGKGAWFNVRQGDAAISAIRTDINQLQKREISVRSFSEFDSHFQPWLLAAIALLLLLMVWPAAPKRTAMKKYMRLNTLAWLLFARPLLS